MKIGGYQIIDLKNLSLSATAVTIEGTYEKIEGTKKPILLSGINIEGTEYHNAYVNFKVDSSNYVGEVYGYTITITAQDEISVEVIGG